MCSVEKANCISDVYVTKKKLGQGTYGSVYLARYKKAKVQEDVALKIVKTENGFVREIDHIIHLQKLQVPFILPLQRVVFLKEEKKMLMEFPLGQDPLKYFAELRKTLPFVEYLSKCMKLFLEMVEGVKWMHCSGIIHRDIKPENMIIWKDHLYLIDFGFSVRFVCKKVLESWQEEDKKFKQFREGINLSGNLSGQEINTSIQSEAEQFDVLQSILSSQENSSSGEKNKVFDRYQFQLLSSNSDPSYQADSHQHLSGSSGSEGLNLSEIEEEFDSTDSLKIRCEYELVSLNYRSPELFSFLATQSVESSEKSNESVENSDSQESAYSENESLESDDYADRSVSTTSERNTLSNQSDKSFSSVETLEEDAYYNELIDEWALGCTFYELLTGNIAFEGLTKEDVVFEHKVYTNFLTKEAKDWKLYESRKTSDFTWFCWINEFILWFENKSKSTRSSSKKQADGNKLSNQGRKKSSTKKSKNSTHHISSKTADVFIGKEKLAPFFKFFKYLIQNLLCHNPEDRSTCAAISEAVCDTDFFNNQVSPSFSPKEKIGSPETGESQNKINASDKLDKSQWISKWEKKEKKIYQVQMSFPTWWKSLYSFLRLQQWKHGENLHIQTILKLLAKICNKHELQTTVFYLSINNWLFWITCDQRKERQSIKSYLDSFLVAFSLACSYCYLEADEIFQVITLIFKELNLVPPKNIKQFYSRTDDFMTELLVRSRGQSWFPTPSPHRKDPHWDCAKDPIYVYYLICALNKSTSVLNCKRIPPGSLKNQTM